MLKIFFLLLSCAAVWGAHSTFPVGISNGRSSCYLSSVLQNFFAIHGVREAVLDVDANASKIHLALAGVFARLQTAPKVQYEIDGPQNSNTDAISIVRDFYKEYTASIKGEQKGLGLVPNRKGDPDVFLTWLTNVLPFMKNFMPTVLEKTLNFNDFTYFSDTEAASSVQVCVGSDASNGKSLQGLLENLGSTIQDVIISPTDNGDINECLLAFGATFGGPHDVEEQYTIKSTGSILPILVKRENVDFSDSEASLQYEEMLIVNGETYLLNGMVIGEQEHFKAVVRTNIISNVWHIFDDEEVRRLEMDEHLSYNQNVALLFYVKESEILQCYSHDEDFKVVIPEHIVAANRALQETAPQQVDTPFLPQRNYENLSGRSGASPYRPPMGLGNPTPRVGPSVGPSAGPSARTPRTPSSNGSGNSTSTTRTFTRLDSRPQRGGNVPRVGTTIPATPAARTVAIPVTRTPTRTPTPTIPVTPTTRTRTAPVTPTTSTISISTATTTTTANGRDGRNGSGSSQSGQAGGQRLNEAAQFDWQRINGNSDNLTHAEAERAFLLALSLSVNDV